MQLSGHTGININPTTAAPDQIVKKESHPQFGNEEYYLHIKTKQTNNKTILVFRDSFSNNLIPYLSEDYQDIFLIWDYTISPDTIKEIQPDVVILEILERYIPIPCK